jgi:hypothetical protein
MIKKLLTMLIVGIGALTIVGLASTTALADGLVFVQPNHDDKIVPPVEVLSLQHHGNSTSESGGVSYNGTQDVLFGDTSAGPHNLTVLYSSLGTNVTNLGILMNINENNGNANGVLFINSLVVTAYTSTGTAIFIGSIDNLGLDQIKPAQGSATDYQFGLDSAAAARLQAALAQDPNIRLGLSGTISNVGGGPERFKFNALASEVPEPATMVLFGMGLAGLAAKVRRNRKQ